MCFETKLLICLVCALVSPLGWSLAARIWLALGCIALFGVSVKSARRAFGYALFYLVICINSLTYLYWGFFFLPFSAMVILHLVLFFFVAMSALIVISSPPGLISAALTRLHVPKPAILGVLVALRFVPTFQAQWHAFKDSMKKRGIFTLRFFCTHPLDYYEYVLVPTSLGLIRSAEQLSASALTRAAEAPFRRTSYYSSCFGRRDILALSSVALMFLIAALLSWSPLADCLMLGGLV